MGTWRLLRPRGVVSQDRGWKVHVSATLDNAEKMLGIVVDHCFEARIAFNGLRSRAFS